LLVLLVTFMLGAVAFAGRERKPAAAPLVHEARSVEAAAPTAPASAPAPSAAPESPAVLLKAARVFAAHGLKVSAERRAAYALAYDLLADVPAAAPEFAAAVALQKDLEARDASAAATKLPAPTDQQLLDLGNRFTCDPGGANCRIVPPSAAPQAPIARGAPSPAPTYTYPEPVPAYVQTLPESGYGEISPVTGLPKTVHVNGYMRNGTYVPPHYRSHR
jgi:hypothetical protein